MKRSKKLLSILVAGVMMASALATTVSANSGTWSIPGNQYGGTYSGFSDTTAKYNGSNLCRYYEAKTTTKQAVPHMYTAMIALYNGDTACFKYDEKQDTKSMSLSYISDKYGNVKVTGTGYHDIWSSSLTRQYHQTQF